MLWFRSKADRDNVAEIVRLRAELDDLGESYMAAVGGRVHAEFAMQKMQKAMTDEGVAKIAAEATAEIADIYAQGRGGVKTRDIAVHAVIARAVREAARGEASWNEGMLAAEAYREVV